MADLVFNVAKGRVAEFFNRVDANDPANSALIVVPIDRGAVTDPQMRDFDTLQACVDGGVTIRSATGWNRKTLTDADVAFSGADDATDSMKVTIANQTWTAVTAGAVTDLLICYDNDTTGGTDTNIIPLTCHAFAITPDGSDVTAQINASGFYQAS